MLKSPAANNEASSLKRPDNGSRNWSLVEFGARPQGLIHQCRRFRGSARPTPPSRLFMDYPALSICLFL